MLRISYFTTINEKYSPIYSVEYVLLSGIIGSVVVFLLLFFFQPFGIHKHSFYWRLFLSLIYSTIPFLLYFVFFLLFRKRIKRGIFFWSLRDEFLYFLLNFFIAGILVYGYSYLIMNVLFPYEFTMAENFFLKSIYYSSVIGFIIYLLSKTLDFFAYFYITADNSAITSRSSSKKMLRFFSNSNNVFKFYSSEILLIESSLNNTIVYLSNDLRIDKVLIKNVSLKEIEKKYPFPKFSLLRCHRSFLVNFNYIKFMRGNSRTTILKLKGGLIIPVSRKRIGLLKKLLQK